MLLFVFLDAAEVKGKVVDVEEFRCTPQLLKRYPHLSHVPLFAAIYLVEVDLGAYLSASTKQHFKEEYKKRQRKRQQNSNKAANVL